ncbi:Txe/YoeB family addiction module toxin [uncultured Helicobacter sp.]|uniref:Txe/YoeB family addiction module toxin n=1 Tax=uncultured Helicobacter sp. TaxID=175537 RepID=UPI00374F0035
MNKVFCDTAWEQYCYWQEYDKKILKKINTLLKDIERNGALNGLGKPEALRGDLNGLCSRRINAEHRLVYYTDTANIYVVACKTHYGEQ